MRAVSGNVACVSFGTPRRGARTRHARGSMHVADETVEVGQFGPYERVQQRTVEETVEVHMVKIVPQEQSSERTREQFRVIEVPEASAKTGVCSAQWCVRLGILSRWTKLFLRSEFLNGFVGGVRLSTCQGNVVAVDSIPQERISARGCEQSEVIDVTKPSLLRIVEQMTDVTEISEIGGEVGSVQ